MEIEDIHQVTLERKAYTAATYIQIALSISFIALLVGFLLLRDTEPEIVLASGILMVVSFASLFPSEKIVSITNPNFKFLTLNLKIIVKSISNNLMMVKNMSC